jgi:hypothetical protein
MSRRMSPAGSESCFSEIWLSVCDMEWNDSLTSEALRVKECGLMLLSPFLVLCLLLDEFHNGFARHVTKKRKTFVGRSIIDFSNIRTITRMSAPALPNRLSDHLMNLLQNV